MRIPGRRIPAFLLAGVVAAGLTGCAPGAPGSPGSSSSPAAGAAEQLSGTITVFAAASLKASFTKLAEQFEARNPGARIMFSFAGSSDLATQISQGAPADVFASADTKNMAKVADDSLVEGSPQNFASNVLTIAVPPANPASIAAFADLARPGVKVVICAPQVPCGAATKTVEKETGIALQPVSEESSVTDVLGKVVAGEADAGLVYVTDVRTAGGKVTEVPFAESSKAVNIYPIATLRTSRNKDLAAAFMAEVLGPEGRKILGDAGFGTT
ncbi:molybdate transport system substrate-binding protein [Arthrobacter ginsengisoli]|uniref:Molybdate transport system substrate-binding protein n=1 Tax=Arthrobacter ginsengisoli TaxID=1356565 RepID=A0ABU1UE34_9MICC|nr:molybdate ABC transporter substrate-binding protein [Arthrobacter ginsengisoli]MDR7083446.1 molybdate transport system substrate-binding protein [Arthrobacter ginsengisoli]